MWSIKVYVDDSPFFHLHTLTSYVLNTCEPCAPYSFVIVNIPQKNTLFTLENKTGNLLKRHNRVEASEKI